MAREFKSISPTFIKFESEGEQVEGILRSKTTIDFQNGPVGKYTLEPETGELISFLGGAVLDQAMNMVEIGNYVRVTFEGISKLDGAKTLKNYKVEVASE